MAKHPKPVRIAESPIEALVNRARKFRNKGELRKALQALREACLMDERCAWVWTLYGSLLTQCHRTQEAQQVYRHAIWLRRVSGDEARVRTTQALLDNLAPSSAAA